MLKNFFKIVSFIIYISSIHYIESFDEFDCFYVDDCKQNNKAYTRCVLNKCIVSSANIYSNICFPRPSKCFELCQHSIKDSIYYNNFTKCCHCGSVKYKNDNVVSKLDCEINCQSLNLDYIISKDNMCHCLNATYQTDFLCADDFRCQKHCEKNIRLDIDMIGTCQENRCLCQRTLFPKKLILCDPKTCFEDARKKNHANGMCDKSKSICLYSKSDISKYGNFTCDDKKCDRLTRGYIFLKNWNGLCNQETNMCEWVKNTYGYQSIETSTQYIL